MAAAVAKAPEVAVAILQEAVTPEVAAVAVAATPTVAANLTEVAAASLVRVRGRKFPRCKRSARTARLRRPSF